MTLYVGLPKKDTHIFVWKFIKNYPMGSIIGTKANYTQISFDKILSALSMLGKGGG